MPGPSSQMPTLFVGDLPADCTESELCMLFEPFGSIASIRMKRGTSGKDNSYTNMNRGEEAKAFYYAFVKFDARQSAEMAFQTMQGFFYRGRSLRVGWTSAGGSDEHGSLRAQAPMAQGHMHMHGPPMHMAPAAPHAHARTAQVHFSYLSKQLDFIISEAFLWDVFSSFGEVVEISLKKSACDEDMCIQNGYGFAHFPLNDAGINSALKAVSALHQVTIHQVSYDCSVSNQLKAIIAKSAAHGMGPSLGNSAPLRRVAQLTGQYLGGEGGYGFGQSGFRGYRDPYAQPSYRAPPPPPPSLSSGYGMDGYGRGAPFYPPHPHPRGAGGYGGEDYYYPPPPSAYPPRREHPRAAGDGYDFDDGCSSLASSLSGGYHPYAPHHPHAPQFQQQQGYGGSSGGGGSVGNRSWLSASGSASTGSGSTRRTEDLGGFSAGYDAPGSRMPNVYPPLGMYETSYGPDYLSPAVGPPSSSSSIGSSPMPNSAADSVSPLSLLLASVSLSPRPSPAQDNDTSGAAVANAADPM